MHALLAEFLSALSAEGHPIGPAELLRVQELVRQLPVDTNAETLAATIIPLFARNPAQQEQLHELWQECRDRVEHRAVEFQDLVEKSSSAALSAEPVTRKWRRILITISILVLGVLAGFWLWYEQPTLTTKYIPPVADRVSDTVTTVYKNLQTKTTGSDIQVFTVRPLPYLDSLSDLRIQKPTGRHQWLNRYWPWVRWSLLLPLTLLFIVLWYYLDYRRRQLVARQERHQQPPYVWNIHLDNPVADQLLSGDAYAQLLLALRRRAGADTWTLDLPASIQATAASGGLPGFRYRQPSRPVDYLLLLDRQHTRNHRARLFETLFHALREQEIAIARFWYDSDLRRCFDESHPEGLAPVDLQQRFSGARLLVVGTGLQLLSPVSGRVVPWIETFHTWKERALLTPLPTAEWSSNEQRLSEHFTLLPATLQSLAFWVDELDSGLDARFEEWRTHILDAPRAAIRPTPGTNPLPLLTLHFDTALLGWIAACAIYPELHWDLTLWLGRRLSPAERPLVTPGYLLSIFRLPWFVEGRMPNEARQALLDYLAASDPKLLRALRIEVADLLAQNPPPRASVAWDDHRLHLVLNQWLTTEDPALLKQLEREIADLLENGAEADLTVLRLLDQPRPGTLDFIVPPTWKKYIHQRGLPALGWQPRWRDLAWLFPLWLALATALLWPYAFLLPPSPCPNGSPVIWQGENYCISSATDSLRWFSRMATDTVNNGQPNLTDFDILAAQAAKLEWRADSAIWHRHRANSAVALFNAGVWYHTRDLRDNACLCFDKIAPFDFDVLSENYLEAMSWCKNRPENPTTEKRSNVTLVTDSPDITLFSTGGKMIFELYLNAGDLKVLGKPSLTAFHKRFNQTTVFDNIFQYAKQRYERQTYANRQPKVSAPQIDGNVMRFAVSDLCKEVLTDAQNPAICAFLNKYLKPCNWILRERLVFTFVYQEQDDGFLLKCEVAGMVASGFYDEVSKNGYTDMQVDFEGYLQEYVKRLQYTFKQKIIDPLDTGSSDFSNGMTFIKGGTFRMGDLFDEGELNEKPVHEVTLPDFYLGQYEVTNAEFCTFLNERRNPSSEIWIDLDSVNGNEKCHIMALGDRFEVEKGYDRYPASFVKWYGAMGYCQWLREKTGQKFRLPTEAEWEYAAREGGKRIRFGNGKDIADPQEINFNSLENHKQTYSLVGQYQARTTLVGTFAPNALGLFDMSGNAWEWCEDLYHDSYNGAPANGSAWLSGTASNRVLRGGSWVSLPQSCRAANRPYDVPNDSYRGMGFRLARTK